MFLCTTWAYETVVYLCINSDLVAQAINFLLTEKLIPSHLLYLLDDILPLGALCVLSRTIDISKFKPQ